MISILAQERLLGFTLGSVLTGFVVLEQRKLIHESVSDPKSQSVDQSQVRDRIFGIWNLRLCGTKLWTRLLNLQLNILVRVNGRDGKVRF